MKATGLSARRFAGSLAAAILAGGLAAAMATPAAALEKITYLLPAPLSLPAFAPWILAKQLGYYKDAGYDVNFVVAKGGVDVAKQVGVGNAEIGGAIGDTPIIVRGNGVPVKVVGLMGGGALTVVVGRTDRGIHTLADLKGKKISVLSYQDTTYYAMLGALSTLGLSKNDVSAEAVGPANVPNFVISGTVDACACTPDWEVDVEHGLAGKTVAIPTRDLFPSMAQAIIASDETIKKRPDMVRAIVKATLKGMKYAMDNPAQAAKVYAEATPAFRGKEDLMQQILANYTKRTYSGQKVIGEMDPDRLAKLQDFYLKQGFIRTKVPLDELYTNAFVK
ncbi:MAG TPA: ABC transporter substrate-binding protein [Hyphomicrobiales bacterium]|nr:ABC transporter substrate-binding protein [Hyphomicrobiales bacterium]